MRQTALLLFFAILSFAGNDVQADADLPGTWQGRLQVWTQDIRLVFRFTRNNDGTFSGTIQSPDQDPKHVEIDDVYFKDDSLALDISEFEAGFEGKFNRDSNAFFGKMRQKGLKLPLKLVKGEADDLLYERPQKPKPPFPYSEEEVRIVNKAGGDTLAGTLTRPTGKKKVPAVILVTGSGPENRDETILGHKPFLLIADYLTRRGYAVLRCDDRGTGASSGNFASATTADFADDAEAQLNYLYHRKDIDRKKIGVLGHSEGGIIAPMLAARNNKVGFIILLAAPAIDMFDLLLAQDSLVSKSSGASRKDIVEQVEVNKLLFDALKHSKDSDEAQRGIVHVLDSMNASGTEIEQTLKQLCSPWMRWYIGYSPQQTLEKVRVPVLALNGEKDIQVPSKINIPVIDSILQKNNVRGYESHIFPGLNHLFQHCKKCSFEEYVHITETMSPEVLEVMGKWMDATVK